MTSNGIVQLVVFLLVLFLLTRPLGAYMARVYQGEHVASIVSQFVRGSAGARP